MVFLEIETSVEERCTPGILKAGITDFFKFINETYV